jgi:RluA family pseudouridine synthase
MLESRRVLVNGRPARSLRQDVSDTDQVEVRDKTSESRGSVGAKLAVPIVYEDDDVLVVDKPVGLLTSTSERERRATLWTMVRNYITSSSSNRRARPGLIHRLDRDASGLLAFSKSNAAYESLKGQFYHHTVERVYAAVVHGAPRPPEGAIESRLVERIDGSVHSTRQHGKGQPAKTEYEVIREENRRALLRVRLHTGRKHQIRAHLAERGWPIVGDRVYGPDPPAALRLMLAATELSFDHPRSGQRLHVKIPPPRQLIEALRMSNPRAGGVSVDG